MDLQLTDRVAIVTGASIGLGRTIAAELAAEGCQTVIVARRTALLEELAREIEGRGQRRPLVITADITAADTPQTITDAVMGAFGRIDILVNNAGGSRPMPGFGTDAEWEEAFLLNFTAARRLTHAIVPLMQARKYGRVINITGADEPLAMNAAMPPNGAVNIWSKALSRMVAADGVTVNCLPPGRLHSEQIDQRLLPTAEIRDAWVAANCPAGYIGEPEDFAGLVTFLCSPRARYITGQVIHIDGGVRRFAH